LKVSIVLELVPHHEGVVLAVHAQPGARSNAIRGVHAGALRVAVTQIAEKGKANRALRDVIARQLQLKKSQVELLSGETSATKKFLIRDIDRDTLSARLERLLAG
jgi:uncharacterized protein (TIGR00251 family)